eukprot:scaffold8909_cov31-Attheya_sp.AAC.1
MGKAQHDNNSPIDGVLIVVKSEIILVIGLQNTVAAKSRSTLEKGLLDLQALSEDFTGHLRSCKITTEIWFLQPEGCLEADFCFISSQPLDFEKARAPAGEHKRKKVKSSNDREYWKEKAREVKQFVAIATFIVGTPSEQAPTTTERVCTKLKACCVEALNAEAKEEQGSGTIEPTLRPAESTRNIATELSRKVRPSFGKMLL